MKVKKDESSMNQVNQTTKLRKLFLAQKQKKTECKNFSRYWPELNLRVYGLIELGCVYLFFALQKNFRKDFISLLVPNTQAAIEVCFATEILCLNNYLF